MLSLFTRRVTLSAYRSTATYTRISSSPASALCNRRLLGTSVHAGPAQAFRNSQRNASTTATATTESTTAGGRKPRRKLTPELKAAEKQLRDEKAAALRAKKKAQAEKEKAAAALKAERMKKLAKAEKEKEKKKAIEAKKPKIIQPPPRRMSAFSLFVQEVRKPLGQVAVDWHNLSEEAKQEYIMRARPIAQKRREEFNAYVKTVTPVDIHRYNRIRRSKGATCIRVKFNSAKRPLSPYMMFAQEFRRRPDQVGRTTMDIARAAGESWRSMTQEEKNQYKHKPVEPTTA